MCDVCTSKMSNMAGTPILTAVKTNHSFFPTKERDVIVALKPKNEQEKQAFAKQHQAYEAKVAALREKHKPIFGYADPAADPTKATTTSVSTTVTATAPKLTTGQKIKAFFTSGDAEKTAKGASSWFDTISNGLGVLNSKSNTTSTINSSNTSLNDGTDTSTYVWCIVGGIALLLGIWAFVHFRNK